MLADHERAGRLSVGWTDRPRWGYVQVAVAVNEDDQDQD
jgi:hypothetical protein